jgi:hypothetical protein
VSRTVEASTSAGNFASSCHVVRDRSDIVELRYRSLTRGLVVGDQRYVNMPCLE